MPTEFRVCDECKMINIKSMVPLLKEIDPQATIEMGCQSYCGIGFKKHFAVVNGRYITAPTEQQLIEKIKKHLARKTI
ncbi:DUF1450 domain-containing protein [Aneurinibacillus sp. Ricciae_BoGa-3]|uniref:DUF1450 domain-containing protein n=1 Tax=Aneurinibacillus sp. Ricciae_BoGa-3 TaxID=3022697 RepID=UPI00234273D0|nr:DUF1450 domain-containing protein [Aneurinibacillus sp. Ricciae_BoGa-3]WCK54395.1 DUF1450 domain-containing protein [Aneurinibacillus sp. Ricciae_BoGa-3]